MAKIKSPKIYDPYLGSMYGNILDQYDNPAYNLKLYMKPDKVGTSTPAGSGTPAVTTQGTGTTSSASARQDTPTASSSPAPSPADKKIVVLAQTGVTGNQIDNLEITGYVDPSRVKSDSPTTTGSFTIIQPGAANFLDQLQWARKYLGASDDKLQTTDMVLYLDITFVGYDSNIDDIDEGGEPTQITDVFTYELRPTEIKIRVDNTGSQYDFKVAVANTVGYADTIYKIPQNFELQGATITELIKDLEKNYNQALEKSATEYLPDKVQFNLDALLKGSSGGIDPDSKTARKPGVNQLGATVQDFIKDESIPHTGTSQTVERTTAINSPEENGPSSVSGSSNKTIPGIRLPVKEGDTIFNIIGKILSMNKEFQSKVTRKEDLNNPGSKKVNDDKTFIYWYDIHCQIENVKWDKKRNMYSRKYIYTPYLIKDARSDIALTTNDYDALKQTGKIGSGSSAKDRPLTALATKRLQNLYNEGLLSKSYFYIFTGLNDQIINLDITYDQGITLLMPPKGGMTGDFSTTTLTALTNSEPVNKDMTLGDKFDAAKKEANKESLVDVFKQLKGLASDVNGLAQSLGRSVSEIKAVIDDVNSATSRSIIQSISGATIDRTLKNIGVSSSSDPAAVPGTVTQVTKTNLGGTGTYSPEVSGFLYAEDLVQPGGNITKQELESAGLLELETKTVTGVTHATPVAKSLANPLSGITVDGPASMMMGYVYRARQSTNFLLNIDLTLRGDPYWLTRINSGTFEKPKPSRDYTVNPVPGGKYYFLLTIGTPRRFDYNISDEDENTGYWSDASTSGIFSGLYFPVEWKNRFNNGIFTTEMKASKEISVPLQWIRRVRPGEAPPNWDDLGASNAQVNDFVYATGLTAVPPGGSSDTRTTIRPEDLQPLQFGNAKSKEAKAKVESYLGRTVTDREFELLVRATAGESGGGAQEDAAIASVILNRAKTNYGGNGGIEGQLYAKNQFQAVTGTKADGNRPNQGFANPTQQQIARATSNILTNLEKYNSAGLDGFVAGNPAAYGPGTDASMRTKALNTPGRVILGNEPNTTIFFKSSLLGKGGG